MESKWEQIGLKLTVATYNVHEWIGNDGCNDPERTLRVIRDLKADLIALQEVSFPVEERVGLRLQDLAEATGMQCIPGQTLSRKDAVFGNMLLTTHPLKRIEHIDLSIDGREPRGAIVATLDIESSIVKVVATHLGRGSGERRKQIERLLEEIDIRYNKLLILIGDLNEWNLFSRFFWYLRSHFGPLLAPPTYPTRFPFLALDRILVCPKEAQTEICVLKTPLARIASDHLPVKAKIKYFSSRV